MNEFLLESENIVPVLDEGNISRVLSHVDKLLNANITTNFRTTGSSLIATSLPGDSPLVMNLDNITYLHEASYLVTWLPDGIRYLMLIQKHKVYLINTFKNVFEVKNLKFWIDQTRKPTEPMNRANEAEISETEEETEEINERNPAIESNENEQTYVALLDGIMIINHKRCNKPRKIIFLIFDVIVCQGRNVGRIASFTQRYKIIADYIYKRKSFLMQNQIEQWLSLRMHYWWPVNMTRRLCDENFINNLPQTCNCLMYRPVQQTYLNSLCFTLIWKPLWRNSVNFRLIIEQQDNISTGHLYVSGLKSPFDSITVTDELSHLNNAIIECTLENQGWVFKRHVVNKEIPNSIDSANFITKYKKETFAWEEWVLEFIDYYTFKGKWVERQ